MGIGNDFRDNREQFRISILSTKVNYGVVWKGDVGQSCSENIYGGMRLSDRLVKNLFLFLGTKLKT